MKALTLGISASTHQIGLIDQLVVSLAPLASKIQVSLDLLITPSATSEDYLTKFERAWGKQNLSVRVRHRGSLGESRNFILETAVTPYVLFMDGDDFLDSKNLEYILNSIGGIDDTADFIVFAGRIYDQGHSSSWLTHLLPNKNPSNVPEFLTWFEHRGWRMTSACVKIYSVMWLRGNKLRFVQDLFYEDTPFWFDIACRVSDDTQIRFFNVEVYNYRRWGSQITETRDARLFQFFWIIDVIKEKLDTHNAPVEVWTAFYAFVLDHLVWSSNRMSESHRPLSEKRLFQTLVDQHARRARSFLLQAGSYHLPQHLDEQLIRAKPGYIENEFTIGALPRKFSSKAKASWKRLLRQT